MDPEFVLMDNIMPQIMGNISQILIMSKGDPDTPILNEAMTGPYKAGFMQAGRSRNWNSMVPGPQSP